MREFKFWSWDKAMEGMQVFLVDPKKIQLAISGVVSDVKRSNKCQLIDGKPVKSTRVVSVTIECAEGEKMTVTRSNPQYQIILK